MRSFKGRQKIVWAQQVQGEGVGAFTNDQGKGFSISVQIEDG